MKAKKAKSQGMVPRVWYATLRKPDGLPVLWGCSREEAEREADFDEYVVKVHVRPVSLRDLFLGERALIAQGVKQPRPRRPPAAKQRRGSGTIKLKGAGMIVAELKKMAPLMRQRFVDAMNGELAALGGKAWIGLDMAKGPDRSAEIKVRRGRNGKLKIREVKRAAPSRVRR